MTGCFNSAPPEPKDSLPDMIGKWKKDNVSWSSNYGLSGSGEKSNVWDTTYSSENDKATAKFSRINYILRTLKTTGAAEKEQASMGNCLSSGAWRTEKIKDQAGKEIGTFTICRYRAQNKGLGDRTFEYHFIFNNENRTVEIKPLTATNQELIEFTKALPFNSQSNLSFIDVLSSVQNLDAATLMKLSPPIKLAKEPYLKGKIAIADIGGIQTENYISDKNKIAETADQMQSLVKIECEKSSSIGQYIIKATNEKVPAFGSLCKVIVIDNTIPAVIQEKTFTNKELPEYNTFYKNIDPKRLGKDKLEYVAPFPREEVKKFIVALPTR